MMLAQQIARARNSAIKCVKGVHPIVKRIELEPYVDAAGENAIKVVVILDEGTRQKDRAYSNLQPLEERICQELQREGITLWPYFWFRTPSEQKEARLAVA